MIPIPDAYRLIEETVQPLGLESIDIANAVNRVLAVEHTSDVDSPPHNKSLMDGFAVRSEDVNSGNRTLEIIETIQAGAVPQNTVERGCASRIMTGAPLPEGADAVVMIELTSETEVDGQACVEVNVDSLAPGQHWIAKSTNIRKGQSVFSVGHRIQATDIGLLAETGAADIQVSRSPRIAVLPTGDELVTCDEVPQDGQIRNSNGPMLLSMIQALGLEATDLGIGRDEKSVLQSLVQKGLEHDLLILTGGVSMGEFDLVPGILAEAGVENVFHKVCIKPGKPIWFGVLKKETGNTVVFGLPGNPVSSLVGFHLFVKTAIRIMTGESETQPSSVHATLINEHDARGNRPTYWPCKWVFDGSTERKIESLTWRGSSDLTALGQADALAFFPAGTATHPVGTKLEVFPLQG